MTENKASWEECDRCGGLFSQDKLKDHVWSTRHKYKGKKDNPIISSSVTFHRVSDNCPAYLCFKCQKKTINEMSMGGNWSG